MGEPITAKKKHKRDLMSVRCIEPNVLILSRSLGGIPRFIEAQTLERLQIAAGLTGRSNYPNE